jgi:hypothetical protein
LKAEGRRGGRGERPAAALYREAGEGLEVEGDPDRWGRPGSEWEREEGEEVGRRRLRGPEEEVGRGRKLGYAGRKGKGGRGLGGFVFFFLFQIHFKPISNPFKIKSFTCFQIQILTQISPTILKAFRKPFFLQLFKHILNSNL